MDITGMLFGPRGRSGLTYGIIATFFMTLIMFTGMITGVSPIPEPIPVAIAQKILGELPQPALMISGMIAHFAYGAIAGLILFQIAVENYQIWQGLAWGVLLWLIMHLLVLPFIGWGFFTSVISIKVVPATLILHLVYGGILGYSFKHHYEYSPCKAYH